MDVSILFASQYLYSKAIILGLEVPSMLENLVEVSQAMNSSCVNGVFIVLESRRLLESPVLFSPYCAELGSMRLFHLFQKRLYRILQLGDFFFYLSTLMSSR
jgi:hypothetical protein